MFFSDPVTSLTSLHFYQKCDISTFPTILSFMKFCVARTFLVEFHLDDVIEVLLGVGLQFLTKLVDAS